MICIEPFGTNLICHLDLLIMAGKILTFLVEPLHIDYMAPYMPYMVKKETPTIIIDASINAKYHSGRFSFVK